MTFIFWLQFATVCVAGAMSPGPSLALIIRNSITINRFAGFMTAHGIGMGVYAVFAVTGLIIILTTNEILFQFIQIIGILFLLFIGFQFLFKKNQEIEHINNQKNFNSFLQGFSIAILNPKILIWFSAVFSQFVKIDASFFFTLNSCHYCICNRWNLVYYSYSCSNKLWNGQFFSKKKKYYSKNIRNNFSFNWYTSNYRFLPKLLRYFYP